MVQVDLFGPITVKVPGFTAFTRLSCEVGIPSYVFLDQDKSAFQLTEVEYMDLQLRLHREKGISFSVCGVGGYDMHGHIERVIHSLQPSLEDCGLKHEILHATGLLHPLFAS